MDLQLITATFTMVFLAELGDKTQLATFCLAADSRSTFSVFLGSALALVLSSFLAVLCGSAFARFVPPHLIKLAAGLFFIAAGIWTLHAAVKSWGT